MDSHPKILIIRLSSIGDIVLTTPIIRCLKKQIPNLELHYLTKANNAIILNNNPYIDKIHTYKGSLSQTIKQLKKENFTYVIDLHKQLRSFLIKLRLLRPFKTFNSLKIRKWLFVKFKLDYLPNKHIVDRYFKPAKALGYKIENDGQGLDYFLEEQDYISPDALPLSFQEGYIAVVVGSKHNTKQMPLDKLIELCQSIEKPIILLGDKNDRKKAIKIENEVGARAFNACGAYDLNQSAALIKNSIGVITPDTGLMHIAAAFDKNIISVWGNTTPQFGMYPYMPKESKSEMHIFETKALKCRPCSKLGYKECPKKHFRCMKEIDTKKIVDIANSWKEIKDK